MEISELQAFIRVSESGSFSVASEQLFLTQPAVSKRIASLESSLETKLFDRVGRQVLLTEAGKRLLPKAKQILTDVSDAKHYITLGEKEVSGELKMATSHHIGLHRLPPILQSYQQRFEDVEISIDFNQSEEAYQQVAKGETELAVITLASVQDELIESIPIWPDPLVCVSSVNHPLAALNTVSLQQLAELPCVLPNKNTFTREMVDLALGKDELRPNVRMSTNNFETLTMLVSIDWGWSLIPSVLVNEKLAVLDVAGLNLTRQLGIIYHKQRTLSLAATKMIEMLRENTSS